MENQYGSSKRGILKGTPNHPTFGKHIHSQLLSPFEANPEWVEHTSSTPIQTNARLSLSEVNSEWHTQPNEETNTTEKAIRELAYRQKSSPAIRLEKAVKARILDTTKVNKEPEMQPSPLARDSAQKSKDSPKKLAKGDEKPIHGDLPKEKTKKSKTSKSKSSTIKLAKSAKKSSLNPVADRSPRNAEEQKKLEEAAEAFDKHRHKYEIIEYEHNGQVFRYKKNLNTLLEKDRQEKEMKDAEERELLEQHRPLITAENRKQFINSTGFATRPRGQPLRASFATSMRQQFSSSAFQQPLFQAPSPFGQNFSSSQVFNAHAYPSNQMPLFGASSGYPYPVNNFGAFPSNYGGFL